MIKIDEIGAIIKEWCQDDPDDNKAVISIIAESGDDGTVHTHQTLFGKHTMIVPLLCSIFEKDADLYRIFKDAVTIYEMVNNKNTEFTKKAIS